MREGWWEGSGMLREGRLRQSGGRSFDERAVGGDI